MTPILYLLYVNHYALNVFQLDDWSTVGFMDSALHGHLTLSQLWTQHHEDRLFLSNAVSVAFAFIDRSDLRSIIFVSAAVLIASYGIVLALFRRYIRRRLTPIPVLVIGAIWFSIGDFSNALFAIQLALYFVVFFFFCVLFALLVPGTHRATWFAVAVLAAAAGSLSSLEGFIAWPIGAICILWCQPWTRRARWEIGIWAVAAITMLAIYLPGYQGSGCDIANCSIGASFAHPVGAGESFLVLLGGVVPGGYPFGGIVHNFARFELVGLALLAVSVFIIIQSWRYRTTREHMPLPMLVICFCLLFDVATVLGRTAEGLAALVNSNRYIMPNLILLVAIVMYTYAHGPSLRRPFSRTRREVLTFAGLFLLAGFLIVQVVLSTSFGLNNGRAEDHFLTEQARLLVNLDNVPVQYRSCELTNVLWLGLAPASTYAAQEKTAARDQFGEFRPNTYRHYLTLGPPPLLKVCTGSTTNANTQTKALSPPSWTAFPNI